MWIPATWTWRAALTCLLLETVLRGVRGRREHGAVLAHKNAVKVQTRSVCSVAPTSIHGVQPFSFNSLI